jgi:hypothetical protein
MTSAKIKQKFDVYTPVWEPGGEEFRGWIKIGTAWRDEHGATFSYIHSLPIDPDENWTGFCQFVETGAREPTPLTITRDKFLEANLPD